MYVGGMEVGRTEEVAPEEGLEEGREELGRGNGEGRVPEAGALVGGFEEQQEAVTRAERRGLGGRG